VWRELRCPGPAAACRFVAALLGWQATPAVGDGFVLRAGERPVGAVRGAAAEGDRPPCWLVHFAVAQLEPALARVAQLGGRAGDAEVVAELGRRAL